MKIHWTAVALSLTTLLGAPTAQAGIIEDLLAKPAVQTLLGRQSDLQMLLKSCSEAKFKQRNAKACQEADEAIRVAKIPPEVRAVLASPAGSASLRQVCLAVQGMPIQDSYLCLEVAKADPLFNQQVQQQRALLAQQARSQSSGDPAR